jgi:UDP-N-acetylglucosamine 2-epimerase (non-hydrolysing)
MAPVIKELRKHPDKFKPVVCVTAQHREMLDQVLDLFEIRPDYDLDIMKPGQDLFDVTGNVLAGLKDILRKERPDIMLVQGDTTTTMAASLAAFYEKVPVGHIEAGLRTHNKFAPFPEEVNRRVTSVIADLHFAPTKKSKQNLINEGVSEKTIWVTGNTVIDALFLILEKIDTENLGPQIEFDLVSRYPQLEKVFTALRLSPHAFRLILVTGHRRENFGEVFENICCALKEIAQRYADVEILYPVHLNPNVQEPVRRILNEVKNIHLIEPVDYLPFVYLMKRSYIIITDSGGVQEEAPSLGKPVLVMRETTERPEAVDAGTVKLVGTDKAKIVSEASELLNNAEAYKTMSMAHNPYGDGKASMRICEVLKRGRR